MEEYRKETKVSSDGTLIITGLPFRAGDPVEVIIRSHEHKGGRGKCYPLRGKPVRYVDPFRSVAEEDWEALK